VSTILTDIGQNMQGELIVCLRCHKEKPTIEFYKRKSRANGLTAWCKVCSNENSRERKTKETPLQKEKKRNLNKQWRLKHPREKDKHYYFEVKTWLEFYKLKCGCIDCGYNKSPYALDFDHVSGEKIMDVSRIRNLDKAKEEVQKCEVRCANCHRIKHHTKVILADCN